MLASYVGGNFHYYWWEGLFLGEGIRSLGSRSWISNSMGATFFCGGMLVVEALFSKLRGFEFATFGTISSIGIVQRSQRMTRRIKITTIRMRLSIIASISDQSCKKDSVIMTEPWRDGCDRPLQQHLLEVITRESGKWRMQRHRMKTKRRVLSSTLPNPQI